MSSLSDYTNYTDNQAVEPAIDPNITRIVVRPQQKEPDVKEPEDSTVRHIFNKLFGLNGEERYQLWPEKVVREGLSAAHDTMTGDIPQYSIDENTGDVHTSPQMIKAGVDMSSLAGTGGLAGVGNEAGVALGSGPILKQAATEVKPFYSAVENAVAGAKQPTADAAQWLGYLKNQPGVKQEELQHLGLDKLQGPISKDDLLKAVQEGQPQIKEVVKGDLSDKDIMTQSKINQEDWDKMTQSQKELIRSGFPINKTKYHSYQLPGGENYREMLLTLPDTSKAQALRLEAENRGYGDKISQWPDQEFANEYRKYVTNATDTGIYKSSHWDEPNVLAHIRMNDRMIDGKKSLHLEEIQSDWHQAGRKHGYKQDNKNKLSIKNEGGIWRVRDENGERVDLNGASGFTTEDGARNAIANNTRDIGGVPDAPFKKTWDELALKKAVTEAVKNGYDQISWTPGEAQAARYDLSKQVDSIKYLKNDDGTYNIVPFKNDRPVHSVEGENIKPEKLPDIVGKEVAEKIVNGHGDREKGASDIRVLSGQDLKVGGQGMKAFYDKMLVDKANALVKKHGGKVEKLKTKAPEFGVFQRINQISPDFPTAAEARAWGKENGYEGKATVRESKAGNPHEMWTVKITPELREHVLKKGFPLFSAGVPVFTPVEGNPFKDNK